MVIVLFFYVGHGNVFHGNDGDGHYHCHGHGHGATILMCFFLIQSGDVVWRVDDELVGVEGDMEGDAEGAEEEEVEEEEGDGDGGDQHGTVTSFEFGEFSVLPLEEVGDGGYLLKTGFLLKLFILAENQLIFT